MASSASAPVPRHTKEVRSTIVARRLGLTSEIEAVSFALIHLLVSFPLTHYYSWLQHSFPHVSFILPCLGQEHVEKTDSMLHDRHRQKMQQWKQRSPAAPQTFLPAEIYIYSLSQAPFKGLIFLTHFFAPIKI